MLNKGFFGKWLQRCGLEEKKKKKIVEESHPGLILGRGIDRGWTSKEEE